MEEKLIEDRLFLKKVIDSYVLHRIKDGILTIEGDSEHIIFGLEPFYKLSKRNCEEIENGYDLEKMATEYASQGKEIDIPYSNGLYYGFLEGFKKRNEILENIPNKPDPKLIESMCLRYRHDFGIIKDEAEKNSLRVTMTQLWEEVVGRGFYAGKKKWDVEIEMETQDVDEAYLEIKNVNSYHFHHYDSGMKTFKKEYLHLYQKPILDKDGCLILKKLE
jgi:hypothetical protein